MIIGGLLNRENGGSVAGRQIPGAVWAHRTVARSRPRGTVSPAATTAVLRGCRGAGSEWMGCADSHGLGIRLPQAGARTLVGNSLRCPISRCDPRRARRRERGTEQPVIEAGLGIEGWAACGGRRTDPPAVHCCVTGGSSLRRLVGRVGLGRDRSREPVGCRLGRPLARSLSRRARPGGACLSSRVRSWPTRETALLVFGGSPGRKTRPPRVQWRPEAGVHTARRPTATPDGNTARKSRRPLPGRERDPQKIHT